MIIPWLLQRGHISAGDVNAEGFNNLIQLDYMGFTEFELGAYGTSLKRLCANISDYKWMAIRTTDDKNKPHIISIFINKKYEGYVRELIFNLYNNKYRLKGFLISKM